MTERVYNLQLTDTQAKGVEMARELANLSRARGVEVGILSGYAGTGKTTTIREIATQVGDIRVLAPTGKAALRVSEATGLPASTIHRWLFQAIEDEITGDVTFVRKPAKDLDVPSSGLIVVDEASMIDDEVWEELTGAAADTDCNILCVGDPFQLPPVSKENKDALVMRDDFKHFDRVNLTEVLRQALDNPIVRASALVREGKVAEALGLLKQVPVSDLLDTVDQLSREGGVSICYMNSTRHNLNRGIRQKRGYGEDLEPNEPLLVMKNCYEVGRFNGEVIPFHRWRCKTRSPVEVKDYYKGTGMSQFGIAEVADDEAILALSYVHGHMDVFNYKALRSGAKKAMWHFQDELIEGERVPLLLANFGYVLTCHKAQGSEWNKVFVYLERNINFNEESGRRWLYTALTRAKREVLLFNERG